MATRKMSLKELNELRGGTSNARKMTKSELEEYRKKGNSANVPLFTNETKTDIQDNEKRDHSHNFGFQLFATKQCIYFLSCIHFFFNYLNIFLYDFIQISTAFLCYR